MKGSEKQVKWAEAIKASKNFQEWIGRGKDDNANQVLVKAVAYFENIQESAFWIDNRDKSEKHLLMKLFDGTLQPKGDGWDRRAKMDKETGVITETWTVIVQDGKGGHKEDRTQTL